MMRRMMALGVVSLGMMCGSLMAPRPASAQGLWFGSVGFGGPAWFGPGVYGPGLYGPGIYGPRFGSGFSPYGFGAVAYPVAVRPVTVTRPVIYGGITPAYVPRPAVRVPLNRAYRRVWRRGW